MASVCFLTDDHINLALLVHLIVCSRLRSPIQIFIGPLLSVHAGLCEAVVHDAEGPHPSRESVVTRAGAGLTRVPDGHLRELLLHNGQIDLQV